MIDTRELNTFLEKIRKCFFTPSSLEEAVRQVLEKIAVNIGARAGSFWLAEEGSSRCLYSMDQELEGFTQPLGAGVVGQVIASGESFLCNQREAVSRLTQILFEAFGYEIRNAATVPMFIEGKVIGALQFVDQLSPNDFNADDLRYLEKVAEIVAGGIPRQPAADEINKRIGELEKRLAALDRFNRIIGKSPAAQKVVEQAQLAARNDFPVLLVGETGTGKELLARSIHENSARRRGPFIAENCAAIAQGIAESELFGHARGAFTHAISERVGLIESANHGTLFLDEIGEMPPGIQINLLRFLQEGEIRRAGENKLRKVDTRLLTATNKDLTRLLHQGTFREDYFFRIRVFQIELPPIRARGNDIVLLARHFVREEDRKRNRPEAMRLDPSVYDLLRRYRFPGNIRELQNAVSVAYAFAEEEKVLRPEHFSETTVRPDLETASLPATPPSVFDRRLTLDALEREYILHVLNQHGGNRSLTAQALGIHANTLTRKLKQVSNV